MKASDRKQLRAIGHHLKPVLIVGAAGVSDAVLAEAERAIHDHELIKVKLHVGERLARQAAAEALAQALRAELVQILGNTVLLFRENNTPDPRLSNRLRPSTKA